MSQALLGLSSSLLSSLLKPRDSIQMELRVRQGRNRKQVKQINSAENSSAGIKEREREMDGSGPAMSRQARWPG